MSERTTGATEEQIEVAIEMSVGGYDGLMPAYVDALRSGKACNERSVWEWSKYLVRPDQRIVDVADLRMIIGGLNTGELESGDYPELGAAANRVWSLIRGGEV